MAHGTATLNSPIVREFPFAYNSAGLDTGLALYTPTEGDVLLEAWIEITQAWDGTTPSGDFFMNGNSGFYNDLGGGLLPSTIDMTVADDSPLDISATTGVSDLRSFAYASNTSATTGKGRLLPGSFTTGAPIQVVVSQTGSVGGGDPGSTQGAAILYLVTATPT